MEFPMLNYTLDTNSSVGFLCNDLRYLYLANILSEKNYNVFVYDMPPVRLSENIKIYSSIKDLCTNAHIIFAPFPLKDVSFLEYLNNSHTLISGNINKDILNYLDENNIKYIDFLKDEDFVLYNSIATAEGAIAKAIELSPLNISYSKSLVLGYGRCGRTIAYTLKNLNSHVTVCTRTCNKLADTSVYNYDTLHFSLLSPEINNYDIIFNTVPSLIISNEMINILKKDTVIIDIASAAGLDHLYAKEKGISTIHYLGIPGKISPKSTADFLFKLLF